ncbi:sporulation YhaL family protein [Shouchella shacheensis]|uniref:sporulation YhaL family protein n=1 Tax=Shouchella shacheensis TaxID=1649580 RepID=UPI00073FDF16|nr:sporulation YhaL family protein [Shouchella shacheensis]
MKSTKVNSVIAVIALLVLIVVFLFTQTPLGPLLLAGPWWIYIVMAGVFVSGYMWLRTMQEENGEEQQWIEQEGAVYMKRIEEARAKREEKS